MCGRFALDLTPKDIVDLFEVLDVDPFPPRYNIAPTQPILMIVRDHPHAPGSNLPPNRAVLVRWGFIPAWAKDPKALPLLINARAETAAEKNSFKAALRHRRTLVPASGFYEWRRDGSGRSQAYWVRPRKQPFVAFAGLMETWAEPGGSEIDTGAILTTSARGEVARIHDRAPIVIHPRDFSRWLDCRNYEPRQVSDLLQPAEADFFEAIPVSDKVNKVANVGPELQQRIEAAAPGSLPDSERKSIPPDQLSLF